MVREVCLVLGQDSKNSWENAERVLGQIGQMCSGSNERCANEIRDMTTYDTNDLIAPSDEQTQNSRPYSPCPFLVVPCQ